MQNIALLVGGSLVTSPSLRFDSVHPFIKETFPFLPHISHLPPNVYPHFRGGSSQLRGLFLFLFFLGLECIYTWITLHLMYF